MLFGRWDLGLKVRWSLRGQPKWPALIKVMLQISAPEPEDAKTAILGFAEQVAKWENQPAHRQVPASSGTAGWRTDSGADSRPAARATSRSTIISTNW